MRWTVVPQGLTVTCGHCNRPVVSDQPLALFAGGRLKRCRDCAAREGWPCDDREVDLERFRLEQDTARERANTTPTPAPITRVLPYREPVPLSSLGATFFDRKEAAIGRDGE